MALTSHRHHNVIHFSVHNYGKVSDIGTIISHDGDISSSLLQCMWQVSSFIDTVAVTVDVEFDFGGESFNTGTGCR
jgi:hypothetical protein